MNTASVVDIDMVNSRIDGAFGTLGRFNDRVDGTDRRHADLAELVRDLTVAVEALERKVESLVKYNIDFASVINKGKG